MRDFVQVENIPKGMELCTDQLGTYLSSYVVGNLESSIRPRHGCKLQRPEQRSRKVNVRAMRTSPLSSQFPSLTVCTRFPPQAPNRVTRRGSCKLTFARPCSLTLRIRSQVPKVGGGATPKEIETSPFRWEHNHLCTPASNCKKSSYPDLGSDTT